MTRGGRRTIAISAAAGVVALGAVLAVPAVQATSTFTFTRIAGANRYDTARQVATTTFTAAPTSLLATGEDFPDALAGSYLAGDPAAPAPVLLTTRTQVPAETNAALVALGTRRILLLGGSSAVATVVETDLSRRGYTVERIQGATRYDTALAVARRLPATGIGSVDGRRTALLASGRTFADALAGAPLAYKSRLPVLLTETGALSPQARQGITDLGIQHVVILGGTAAVSQAAEDQVKALSGVTTARLQGADRTATAMAIAEFAVTRLSFSDRHVSLARGDDAGRGADALAGGSHGGKEAGPVLLAASPTSLDTGSRANATWLGNHRTTLETGHIFGGTAAVSGAVADAAAAAGGALPPEAGAGPSTPTVASVLLGEDVFTSTAGRSYFYDANDAFQFRGATVTLAQFEALVNPDDILTVTYDPNAAGASTLNLTGDVVHSPAAPGATVTNADGGALADDIRVTAAPPPITNSSGTTYALQRAPAVCGGPPGPFADVAGSDLSDGTHLDSDLAPGCYLYRVLARSPAPSTVAEPGAASDQVVVPGSPDTAQPTIVDARATADAGTTGSADAGDSHRFDFSEVMHPSTASAGASYRVSDGDGTVVDLTCGTNATCTLTLEAKPGTPPSSFSRLTVSVGAPAPVNPGTVAGLQYPATIVSVTGHFKDVADNPVALPGSDAIIQVGAAT